MGIAEKRWTLAFRILYVSLIIFCFLFGTPVIGRMVADSVYRAICPYQSSSCFFLSYDMGLLYDAYHLPIVGALLTPMSFLMAFGPLLIM